MAEIGQACAASVHGPTTAAAAVAARWLPRRRPRVLAVELSDPDGALAHLQSTLADRLAAGGWYEPERRRFLPHVTVARVGRGRGDALPGRSGALPDPPAASFLISRVSLMRSHLGPGGSRYERLGVYELGPGPA